MGNQSVMGDHVVMDIMTADSSLLDDEEYILELLESAATMIGATILHSHSHKFSPQGVTAFVMLAESHISIHTWPETGDCAVDAFTCGTADPRTAADFICAGVEGWAHNVQEIRRYKLDDPTILDM